MPFGRSKTFPRFCSFRRIIHGVCLSVIVVVILFVLLVLYDPGSESNDLQNNSNSPTQFSESKNSLNKLSLVELEKRDDHICRQATAESKRDIDISNCLGPPFLYITYHGGNRNTDVTTVCKYTRDGCSLGSALKRSHLHAPHSFRGILIDNGYLYVADAWKEKSRILLYGRCDASHGQRRELLRVLAGTGKDSELLNHPYGLAQNPNDPDHLYVSVQGTRSVLKYKKTTKEDAPENEKYGLDFKGRFIDLGEDEIRGIAFDEKNNLYVADKSKGVCLYTDKGEFVKFLKPKVKKPISVYFNKATNTLWVGSAGVHELYEFNLDNHQLLQNFPLTDLEHPAGIAMLDDSIFVISQATNQLLEISASTGSLLNIVLPSLPDRGERIILSPC